RGALPLPLGDHPALAVAVGLDVAEDLVHLGQHDRGWPGAVHVEEPGAPPAQLGDGRFGWVDAGLGACDRRLGVGHVVTGSSTSRPPRNGRRAAGTTTDPSACWWFSRIATIQRVV